MILISLVVVLAIVINEMRDFCWIVSSAEKGVAIESVRLCRTWGLYEPNNGFGHPIGWFLMHIEKIIYWAYISLPIVFLIDLVRKHKKS